jgi:3-deoxy-D-manno-octulosonate 8-phosphate phosphatase (KDO 8-P phosphatase)
MDPNAAAQLFATLGGQFLTPPKKLKEKLRYIRAYVFDWDGVFNSGAKSDIQPSTFTEPDAVATNMLRLSHYLDIGTHPKTAIITGAENPTAIHFAEREHFTAVYSKTLHKIDAIEHFRNAHKLKLEEIAFVFDDVLDLSVAKKVGLRICLGRTIGLIFNDYVRKNNLADYMTVTHGGNYGLRESCEMLIGIRGNHEVTFEARMAFIGKYETYLQQRNSIPTQLYTRASGKIEAVLDSII